MTLLFTFFLRKMYLIIGLEKSLRVVRRVERRQPQNQKQTPPIFLLRGAGGEALHLRRHGVREATEAALRHLAPRDSAATAQRLRGRGTARKREEQRRDESIASPDLLRARGRLVVKAQGRGESGVRVRVMVTARIRVEG